MKAAVYGSGALGTAIGALIANSGEQIDLIDNNRTQVEALRTKGAVLEGCKNLTVPVNAIFPEEAEPGYDVILLAVNEKSNEVALPHIKKILKDDGILVSLQNGFTDFQIVEELGSERVMGCAVDWTSETVEPAHVIVKSAEGRLRAYIGKSTGVSSRPAMNARTLLEKAGDVHYINNLLGARWGKLVINCSLSMTSFVYGGTFGETVANKKCQDLIVRSANECMKVADALDITIPNFEDINFYKVARYSTVFGKMRRMRDLPGLLKYHKDARTILFQNLEQGKPLDLEYVSGVVIQYGKEKGIKTPVIQKLQDAARAIERGDIKSGPETIEALC